MADPTEKKTAETASWQKAELIYQSPPSEADDDLWLAHGAKMLEDSVPSLRNAASELIRSVGMLMTVYLAILGFAKIIPENITVYKKVLFGAPILPWVIATYCCLRAMKPKVTQIKLRSPSDIREKATEVLKQKQRYLETAFVLLIVGIVCAFVMVVFRVQV